MADDRPHLKPGFSADEPEAVENDHDDCPLQRRQRTTRLSAGLCCLSERRIRILPIA